MEKISSDTMKRPREKERGSVGDTDAELSVCQVCRIGRIKRSVTLKAWAVYSSSHVVLFTQYVGQRAANLSVKAGRVCLDSTSFSAAALKGHKPRKCSD